MNRLSPVALLLLPLVAGCCCCGGMSGGTHVPADQLPGVKSLTLSGLGDATVTVGSEPYKIDTESALGSSSTLAGSDLTLEIGLGEASAALPQLDSVSVGETTGLDLQGVDVSAFTLKKSGLGTVVVSGKTTTLTVDADGLCSVDLKDLAAENVTVNINGDGTSVEVHATGTLTVNITGDGSSVSHTGGATVTENVTGSSTVTNLDGDGTETDGTDPVDGTEPTDGTEPQPQDGEGFDGAATPTETP